MLGKKSRPVIELLTGSLISGTRSGFSEAAAARRTHHLEPKAPSPKGLRKSFDFGGVGLGIVAALEKSSDDRNEIPALFSRNSSRSSPIPITSPRNSSRVRESVEEEEIESESLDEYTTIVTRHAPNKSYTKVYCDGRRGADRSTFRNGSNRGSVFHISPARSADFAGAPAHDFLSACDLCRKKLQGEDIYMYRGEKAFCSTECRYRQIVMDERTEKCSSEAMRTVDVSSSPYANGQIFTTGILAI